MGVGRHAGGTANDGDLHNDHAFVNGGFAGPSWTRCNLRGGRGGNWSGIFPSCLRRLWYLLHSANGMYSGLGLLQCVNIHEVKRRGYMRLNQMQEAPCGLHKCGIFFSYAVP